MGNPREEIVVDFDDNMAGNCPVWTFCGYPMKPNFLPEKLSHPYAR
jgi:hypothetical protein